MSLFLAGSESVRLRLVHMCEDLNTNAINHRSCRGNNQETRKQNETKTEGRVNLVTPKRDKRTITLDVEKGPEYLLINSALFGQKVRATPRLLVKNALEIAVKDS